MDLDRYLQGPRHAILTENGDVLECDLMTWARSMEEGYRRIRQEYLAGDYWLSTVFLGLDHNYGLQGPPLWFETMIFEPPTGDVSPITGRVSEHGSPIYTDRYTTLAQALEGHALAKQWFEERETTDESNLRRYDRLCAPGTGDATSGLPEVDPERPDGTGESGPGDRDHGSDR